MFVNKDKIFQDMFEKSKGTSKIKTYFLWSILSFHNSNLPTPCHYELMKVKHLYEINQIELEKYIVQTVFKN